MEKIRGATQQECCVAPFCGRSLDDGIVTLCNDNVLTKTEFMSIL